ncbi:Oidioi.mRNA.OKI2018_I69.PAR.g11317.t1.cds [Oikopleura dioica]|uniref:non-specific serine/threonine protein kinase n=1 Tax=Oikopleura dioica TaxID=34765 RepID=A0ABN7S0W2_OIKDI|nr:Oidioi.mRNA.OKI2018_I69.PAR.g11317.t1.cds [Oikopleura dioica]
MRDRFIIDEGQTVCVRRRTVPEPVPMFQIKNQLGSGGFGAVYEALKINSKTKSDETVVLKLERADAEYPQLKIEYTIYTKLHDRQSKKLRNFAFFHRFACDVELQSKEVVDDPRLPDFGQVKFRGPQSFNILALEKLGPDLLTILKYAKANDFYLLNKHYNQKYNKGLSFTTVINTGEQIFSALEYLHSKNLLHRDIKPQNILTGRDDRKQNIFLVDFGLSKCYRNGEMPDEHKHGPGTDFYKSINITSPSKDQRENISSASLRDDCISAIYVLIELYKGELPWGKYDRSQKKKIYEMKEALLNEKKWKAEFPELLPLCPVLEDLHVLQFGETPPYRDIKQTFDAMKTHRNYRQDEYLDWLIEENGFDILWQPKITKRRTC